MNTNPIYIKLQILKLHDVIYFHNAILCMVTIPVICQAFLIHFFIKVNQMFNTRLASKSSFSLPQIRANSGKLNIRFTDPNVWNSTDEKTKTLSKYMFKKKLKSCLVESYRSLDLLQSNILQILIMFIKFRGCL